MKTKRRDKFFDRLRDGLYYAFKKKSWGELHAFFEQQLGGGDAGKATVNKQLKEYRSWVHIAASVIYRRVSQIDYKFYRDDTREEVKSGKQYQILSKIFRDPNPYMEFRFIKQFLQLQLDLTGAAFCLRIDDPVFRLPREFYPLNTSDLVKIHKGSTFKNWIEGYTFMQGGKQVTYSPNNILYFHYPHPKDPRDPCSPIQSQAYAIDVDHYIEVYERDFFKNSARPDFYIRFKDAMDDDDIERIREQWNKKFKGEGKYHELAILDSDGEIGTLNPKNEDLALMFLANWAADKIMASFGVPPGKVGLVKDVNKANAEGIDITFNAECIRPRLSLIDEVFTRGICQRFDERLLIKHDNPVPRDRKLDIEEIKTKVGVPTWTINEGREAEGKKPVDGGDKIYMQVQYMPLGTSYEPPEVTPPEKPEEEEEGVNEEKKQVKTVLDSEEWRDRKWKLFNNSFIQWEQLWKSRLKELFRDQQEEVLSNIEQHAGKIIPVMRKRGKLRNNFIKEWEKTLNNYIGKNYSKIADEIKKDAILLERLILIHEEKFIELIAEGLVENRNAFEMIDKIDQYINVKKEGVIDYILFDWDNNIEAFNKEGKRLHTSIYTEAGTQALTEFGLDMTFDITNPEVQKFLGNKVRDFSNHVLSTKYDALRDTLSEGVSKGESIEKLKARVQVVYGSMLSGGYDAERIARTETLSSLNGGTFEGYKQSGVVEQKEWLSARLQGTRGQSSSDSADHLSMDKQRVDLDAPFIDHRANAKMMYPGDSSLGAPASTRINCKCAMIGHIEPIEDEFTEDI